MTPICLGEGGICFNVGRKDDLSPLRSGVAGRFVVLLRMRRAAGRARAERLPRLRRGKSARRALLRHVRNAPCGSGCTRGARCDARTRTRRCARARGNACSRGDARARGSRGDARACGSRCYSCTRGDTCSRCDAGARCACGNARACGSRAGNAARNGDELSFGI